jgi:hypothetical protein
MFSTSMNRQVDLLVSLAFSPLSSSLDSVCVFFFGIDPSRHYSTGEFPCEAFQQRNSRGSSQAGPLRCPLSTPESCTGSKLSVCLQSGGSAPLAKRPKYVFLMFSGVRPSSDAIHFNLRFLCSFEWGCHRHVFFVLTLLPIETHEAAAALPGDAGPLGNAPCALTQCIESAFGKHSKAHAISAGGIL